MSILRTGNYRKCKFITDKGMKGQEQHRLGKLNSKSKVWEQGQPKREVRQG